MTIINAYQLYPWQQNTIISYAKRLRATFASAVDTRAWTILITDLLAHGSAYFVYDKTDKTNTIKPYVSLSETDRATLDMVKERKIASTLDGRLIINSQKTVDGQIINTTETIDSLLNIGQVRQVTLTYTPITEHSASYAATAYHLDALVNHSLSKLTIPETFISGLSEGVTVQSSDSHDPNDIRAIPANEDNNGVVKADIKNLDQWDNSQILTMYQTLAMLYMNETHTPIQDMEIMNPVNIKTDVTNNSREPFISMINMIRNDINAVFMPLGVTVDYDSVFPLTASDMSSIGDALSKGLLTQGVDSSNITQPLESIATDNVNTESTVE